MPKHRVPLHLAKDATRMSAINTISVEKLSRLIGTPRCPSLIDVRAAANVERSGLLPGSIHRPFIPEASWTRGLNGKGAIAICEHGHELSQGAAAWLRHNRISADILEGGIDAWTAAKLPLVRTAKIPPRDKDGRTIWVTRSRPKIDRIACPWLIRRFIDPNAVFLYVTASEVGGVAEKFGATPFDCENIFWSHRGELCTFDVMIEEFGLDFPALKHLALIVRGADTARLDLVPEAAGLLAASLGLSRMYADDLEQLEAGMLLYDAFYRWCRDATGETHNWPSHKAKN
jgi:rhodanese-related sulfurtransferase